MTLRNAFENLAEEATLEDVVRLLALIATNLPERDNARGLVSAVVTSAPSTAVTGTITANQGTASTSATWPVTLGGPSGLDQHYQSLQAFDAIRTKITVGS